ncbi:MAG: hypothetical protein LAO19_04905 [Acidobacteriia bacterium]|nr:hypothetical protein [Terriglobia bacterium]
MSVLGIASGILSVLNSSRPQPGQNRFQQIRGEFQQLGQDLQSGNLSGAQQDFTALSHNLPGLSQSGSSANNFSNLLNSLAGSSSTGTNPLTQAFQQLGQDLQSGNLQAAQKDYTNIQQTAQQEVQQGAQPSAGHRHRHHRVDSDQDSSSSSPSSSSQQANPVAQAFSTLAQDLHVGNLQGAQQAFATLQNDLQQIGGFVTSGANGAAGAAIPSGAGSLNVTV